MSIALPGQIPLCWWKADIPGPLDAANRVSRWPDNGTASFDGYALDDTGAASPLASRPIYTTNVCPSGLAGLDWGTFVYGPLGRYLNNLQTPNVPLPSMAPRTLLALIKPNQASPGRIFSFRRTPGSITFDMSSQEHFAGGPNLFPVYAFDRTGTSHMRVGGIYTPLGAGTPASNTTIDYTNTPVVVAWTMDGTGNVTVYVNGLLRATFDFNNVDNSGTNTSGVQGAYPMQSDNGASGFMIGNSAIDAGIQLSGFLCELILYPGVLDSVIPTSVYLMQRGGIIGNAHPPLGTSNPAPTGHMFRYAPKAFGDVYQRPGGN